MIKLTEKLSKRLVQFHQLSLILIMFTTLMTILYFWQLGFVDGSRAKELHKTSFILESFDNKNYLNEVKNKIKDQDPKAAISKLKSYEKELENVDSLIDKDSYKKLKKNIQQMKVASANLISFSSTRKIINVFNNKMKKFNTFVKNSEWRTLARMSDRILAKTTGHIDQKKLGRLVSFISKEFTQMSSVTENSVLSRKDKSEVISRISNLNIEVKMIQKYLVEKKFALQIFDDLNSSYNTWHDEVYPELTLEKIQAEQIGRYYVMGFVGILFLVASIFFSGFLFTKYYHRKTTTILENDLESYVSYGLLEQSSEEFESFSENFQHFSKKIAGYISKRMSFGSIFQEALPFSAILLDKNLKIEWANKHFCSDWDITDEEIKKDYMSWDYLNKLTNIGEDDPVLEALKNKVAGIYQVQVRVNENARVVPYEMFVSPVRFKDESKIMLFFYDLTSSEQTITDQALSIVNPVKSSLKSMLSNTFSASKELENEFSIAGITDVYESFTKLKENYAKREDELIDEIEFLHQQIEEEEKANDEVKIANLNLVAVNKKNVEALKIFKKNVIELSGTAKSLDSISRKEVDLLNTNVNALRESSIKIDSMKNLSAEVVDSFENMMIVKNSLKFERKEVNELRAKFTQEMAAISLSAKKSLNKPEQQVRLVSSIEKLAEAYSQLEGRSENLDRQLSQLEIQLGKSELILQSANKKLNLINSDYEKQQYDLSEKEVHSIRRLTASSTDGINTNEEEIIEGLQVIFHSSKSIAENNHKIDSCLSR